MSSDPKVMFSKVAPLVRSTVQKLKDFNLQIIKAVLEEVLLTHRENAPSSSSMIRKMDVKG